MENEQAEACSLKKRHLVQVLSFELISFKASVAEPELPGAELLFSWAGVAPELKLLFYWCRSCPELELLFSGAGVARS